VRRSTPRRARERRNRTTTRAVDAMTASGASAAARATRADVETIGAEVFRDAVDDGLHDAVCAWVAEELERGRRGELEGKTHAPVPPKWARRDQSREMLQYGTYTHSNRVDAETRVAAMPAIFEDVLDALVARGVIGKDEKMDSCTVNVYGKGQWIPPHIDNPTFARPFVTVSLASAQTMTMGRGMLWPSGDEKPDPGVVYEGEEFRVVLPAKSAVRMEGRAADEYEHAIPPVSEDRISLTFRRRMAANTEGDAIAAQMAMTEQFRAMYREKRAVGRDDSLKEPKEVSEEQRRRESIAAERAAIKAAREERKKAKQLRKEGKRSDALEMEEATRKNPSPSVKTSVSNAGTTATELVKKPPKRACAVVPENFIDAAEKVTAMPEVEREHVQKVYDIVAQQWHGTRYRAWTGVEAFVRKQPPGLLAADVGCGNGKNIPEIVKGGGFALGSDFSRGLIEICRDSGYEVMVADAVILPYRSDVFDYALNIAVLHHISSPERRVELVKETMRIVKVGGVALFYAWALEQEQGGVSGHQFEGQDVLVPFHNKIKVKGVAPEDERERQSRVSGAPTHGEADREKRSVVYQRYCHVYTEGELPKLFENLPWCEVTAAYYDHGNWCVEVLKTSRP
jgi:alkylated DNA repair protein alkB family protein 8